MAEWKLFYWHSLPGRGDYVRLMFEEAGVAYDDIMRRRREAPKQSSNSTEVTLTDSLYWLRP